MVEVSGKTSGSSEISKMAKNIVASNLLISFTTNAVTGVPKVYYALNMSIFVELSSRLTFLHHYKVPDMISDWQGCLVQW